MLTKAGERLGLEDMNGEIRALNYSKAKIYINHEESYLYYIDTFKYDGFKHSKIKQADYFRDKCKKLSLKDLSTSERKNLFKVLMEN